MLQGFLFTIRKNGRFSPTTGPVTMGSLDVVPSHLKRSDLQPLDGFYPPSHKTTGIRSWMTAKGGPSEARLAPWSTPHGRDESLRVRIYFTGQA